MKIKIAVFLSLIVFFCACQSAKKESILGNWSIVSILPIDPISGTSGLEVAAIGWLNSVVSESTIEFYENGEYEIKKDGTSFEKGKYSVSGDVIEITKASGSVEKSAINFKNADELEIKSSTMSLSLKKK